MRAMAAARGRRLGTLLAGALVVALAGGIAGWALRTVFAPPSALTGDAPWTTVEVSAGDVGSSIVLNTVITWPTTPAGVNRATGTVTTVAAVAGDEVAAGTVLYTVDLRPVIVAQGAVPAFRDLGRGARGDDVAQLEGLLVASGHLTGPADAVFDAATERAVRAWQRALGITVDGTVRVGDVVFVPQLPARIALDPELVHLGALLAGGEQALSVVTSEPSFVVPVDPNQAATMPVGTQVEIHLDELTWTALVVAHEAAADPGDQAVQVRLGPVEGASSVCGADCTRLPVGQRTVLSSTVVLQPTVAGLVVPSSALRSGADGEVTVIDAEGTVHPVTVVAGARGMTVIEGVPAGTRVRVPAVADEDPA